MLNKTFALALAVAPSVTQTAPVQAQTYFGPGDVSMTARDSITTSAVSFEDVDDLDLASVFFGAQLTGRAGAENEVVFAN